MENIPSNSAYLFLGVSIFLFFRKVEGSGAENKADVKLIKFGYMAEDFIY